MIAITERGICWLSFLSSAGDAACALEELKASWDKSALLEDKVVTGEYISQIFGTATGKKLHLFVKGTNFQIKVWEALLRIPAGGLTTYQDIARRINNPKALQAVGSAVGSNNIAFLIPCHRVIASNGSLGGYSGGSGIEAKRWLLQLEGAL